MKTTEITVQVYPHEIKELTYNPQKKIEWRGHLPIVIKTGDNEQEIIVPYQINIVIKSEATVDYDGDALDEDLDADDVAEAQSQELYRI